MTLAEASVFLAIAAILAPTAIAQAQTTPTLTLPEGTTALTVKGDSGEDTAQAHLPVFNSSTGRITPTVKLQASSADGLELSSVTEPRVPPGAAGSIDLTFKGLSDLDEKVDGQLVVSGGTAPQLREVSITPGPQPAVGISWAIVVCAIAAAAVVLMLVWVRRESSRDSDLQGNLEKAAPTLTLDFGKSWSTNLTAIGGVLATVLAGVTYPDVPRQIGKDGVTALSLLFAGLVVVAPFVFQGLRHNPPDQKALRDLTGTNRGLAIACSITFGAVIGELLTLVLLGWELIQGTVGVLLLFLGVLVLCGLAARYTRHGIRDFLLRDWEWEAKEAWKTAYPPPSGGKAETREQDLTDQGQVPTVVVASPSAPPRATLL